LNDYRRLDQETLVPYREVKKKSTTRRVYVNLQSRVFSGSLGSDMSGNLLFHLSVNSEEFPFIIAR
jgi:hypothetical protein